MTTFTLFNLIGLGVVLAVAAIGIWRAPKEW